MCSASAISVRRSLEGRDSTAKYPSSERRSGLAMIVRRRRRTTDDDVSHADPGTSPLPVLPAWLSAAASHSSSAGRSACMLLQLSVRDSKRQIVLWLSGVAVGRRRARAAPTSAWVALSRILRSRNCSAKRRNSSLMLLDCADGASLKSVCSFIVEEHSTSSPTPARAQQGSWSNPAMAAAIIHLRLN